MIVSFKDKGTEKLAKSERVKKFEAFSDVALRKLAMLRAAVSLNDLLVPPGNRVEALQGSQKGQSSIRINYQYRTRFTWKEDGAHDVEIVDYH